MSIIYEALRKKEKKENRIKSSKNMSLVLLIGFIGVCIFTICIWSYFSQTDRKQPKVLTRLNSRGVSGIKRLGGKTKGFKYNLEGIIYDEEAPLALINGKRVKVGDKIEDAKLVSVSRDSVGLEDREGKIYLSLGY